MRAVLILCIRATYYEWQGIASVVAVRFTPVERWSGASNKPQIGVCGLRHVPVVLIQCLEGERRNGVPGFLTGCSDLSHPFGTVARLQQAVGVLITLHCHL
ncbi:hypothetical protein [uncultured Ruegeria sp.]|uniref:hypothetical protein n=1 Tax=uncultured Ruegeria sp. TaxID=259304 RepID=UPI002623FBF1|nr:hypothetical protein [uncultured Ruegeria sp.]